MKIISGGQTGADRGGLDAAIELELEHGGWCPKGRLAEDGIIPSRYQLVEASSKDYPKRTRLNVKMAEVTIIFTGSDDAELSRGSKLTQRLCIEHKKPCMVANPFTALDFLAGAIKGFINKHNATTVNIAGTRESKEPGIQEAVKSILVAALWPADA